jgi:hypothetical protein
VETITKYKPGDVVTVRSDLNQFIPYTMSDGKNEMIPASQMLTKRGKSVKIKSVTKTGKYMIEGSMFPWVDEMFEDTTKVEPKTTKTPKKEVKKTDPLVTDKFSWEEFEKDKIVVRCSTKEDFKDFLEQCEVRGYRWMSYHKPTEYYDFYYKERGVGVYYESCKKISKSDSDYCEIYANNVGAKIYDWKKGVESTKTWELVIRGDGDNTTAEYIENDIRTTVKAHRFFEDQYSVRKAIEAVVNKCVPEEKWVVSVKFDKGTRVYDYLTTDNTIKVGDKVVVATGSDEHHVPVTVVKIIPIKEYVPSGYTLKDIVRKCEKGEEPVYYNGKVVCTWRDEGRSYTVGKIYEVVDGRFKLDNGFMFPTSPARTFNDLCDKLHHNVNFVEIVE